MTILALEKITIRFGGLTAAQEVNLTVNSGELTALIGPNGAGKSTVFNVISGIYRQDSGQILLNGEEITEYPCYIRVRKGIGRTFQTVQLFENLTTFENILIGLHIYYRCSLWQQLFQTSSAIVQEHRAQENAEKILELLNLSWARDYSVAYLPYGVRKIIEIGRTLALEPRIILIDEPVGGMTAEEIREFERILQLIRNQRSIDILLIDHNMSFVMGVADYIYVMNEGKIIAHGRSEEVKHNQGVIEAYLGREDGT